MRSRGLGRCLHPRVRTGALTGPRLPVPAERAARPCASPLASSAARPGFGARGRQRGPGRRVPFISISRPPTLSGLTPASPDRVWPSLRAACARCCFCHLPNARCARGAAAGGPASRAAASQGRAGGLCIGRARWWGTPALGGHTSWRVGKGLASACGLRPAPAGRRVLAVSRVHGVSGRGNSACQPHVGVPSPAPPRPASPLPPRGLPRCSVLRPRSPPCLPGLSPGL